LDQDLVEKITKQRRKKTGKHLARVLAVEDILTKVQERGVMEL
jgi:hypothetical protein